MKEKTYLVKVYYKHESGKIKVQEFVFRCSDKEIHDYIYQELKIIGKTRRITDVMLFQKIEDIDINYSDVSFI